VFNVVDLLTCFFLKLRNDTVNSLFKSFQQMLYRFTWFIQTLHGATVFKS